MSSYKVRWFKDLDIFLILVVLALCAVSMLAISSATHSLEGGSKTYVIKQVVWGLIGLGVMIWLVRTDYRNLTRYVEFGYGVSIVLLILVFFFERVNGAHGWIPLGGFALQPSEFFKVVFILMVAKYLANEQEDEEGRRADPIRNYLFLAVYSVLAIGLIVVEPDLGQTMVLMAILAAAMFVHLPSRVFWTLAGIALVVLAVVVVAVFMYPDQFLTLLDTLVKKGILAQHQYGRFESFIYPERDLAGSGYQVYQAKVAIGSGQMFGKGLYQGSQTQGSWVPEQQTDFIFTVIGEELGFVGSVAVIFLFFLMIYRIVANGLQAGDRTGMYICSMVAGMFTLQIFENIGMSLQLMPMTGVTLPFISYGGSSVLTNFMLTGIVLNIGLRRRKLSFVS
ncbi:FtsW/RodA/SpoVE family cell cycle protein [Tumebacillus permanentifrigoris]|uniref:Rod shape determining protein RodA n=1 Tax=Tumebacillus permanentifrigoris TaxID=378543 RepID=A0A316DS05_9BACL|nr:FtsW/RodA/SpoVE family cell cycle protein [Tumebacillus permanentifrigoris]PWK07928.1 rod shape determining protein RodA [Tumebacillus permanentifrigoris]